MFHDPVDWERMGLLTYPSVVKHPMDFGTVKTKLAFNAYFDADEFRGDMNLVFDNCILFNTKESVYGRIAFEMKHEFNAMATR